MTKNNRFSPASEEGHFNGLVDEGVYLLQSLLYKQILPRPVRRSFSEGGTPSRRKTSVTSVARNLFNLRNLLFIKDLRLYICRDTLTHVMSALQIQLFLQNKAKFRKVKLNVNKVLTMDYDQMDTWSIRTKQSQTNPNKAKTNPILAKKTQYEPNSNPNKPNFKRNICSPHRFYTITCLWQFFH
ncbi:MAG: hypothetical protein GWN67_16860 [Phycisphaerae bacterium]|nr:hypothetical protein [Phycisphaerae bacterium]NIP54378.1 hypothetical protein [Phycisphaerae bacterium]NIS53237.1 hypothetical protein [Phycisphaerae bacterium]NIU10762.1 hypothetical protein [Phycisphaerae bacterium]NIU57997.1 hypothetical protein [Phycisphaerae bacterium]